MSILVSCAYLISSSSLSCLFLLLMGDFIDSYAVDKALGFVGNWHWIVEE
jgi:hypothetical protein